MEYDLTPQINKAKSLIFQWVSELTGPLIYWQQKAQKSASNASQGGPGIGCFYGSLGAISHTADVALRQGETSARDRSP
jgi:hypothetical protein